MEKARRSNASCGCNQNPAAAAAALKITIPAGPHGVAQLCRSLNVHPSARLVFFFTRFHELNGLLFLQVPVVCLCGATQPAPAPPQLADAFDLVVTLLQDGVGMRLFASLTLDP
jgi:hypothetical protein